MKKLFAALFAFVLICALVLPVVALGDVSCFIEGLGRELAVPDSWVMDTNVKGVVGFTHVLSQGRMFFYIDGVPVEEIDTDVTTDEMLLGAEMLAKASGAGEPLPASTFDYASDERRIVGGSVTYELNAQRMVMWVCFYTSIRNTWDTCSFAVPADGSLDISWFIDELEAAFPELADVQLFKTEAAVATEEPAVATEEPVVATEEPAVAAEEPIAASCGEADTGTYEGERNEQGQRSGFGMWAYHNYLYVGNWENDKPNGEGTLYYRIIYMDSEAKNVIFSQYSYVIHGHWVNGAAEGTVDYSLLSFYSATDREETYVFRLDNAKDGWRTNDQPVAALNARHEEEYFGMLAVPPWFGDLQADSEVDTPWDLYEKYPDGKVPYIPLEQIENIGMGISPGNLANRGGFHFYGTDMALLGDWIFLAMSDDEVVTIYKMRTDGSQMIKIFEYSSKNKTGGGHFSTRFQVVGDWLYVGEPYKIKAEDVELTAMEGWYLWNPVIDDWEYEVVYTEDNTRKVQRTKLDYSQRINMGSFVEDKRLDGVMRWNEILFADENWIYFYKSNDASLSVPVSDYVSQITKLKRDGSGEVEIRLFREEIGNPFLGCEMPQIVGGRMFYMEAYALGGFKIECSLHSVDPDFTQEPVTLIARDADYYILQFHVTDDYIYYGTVTDADGRWAIMRINHDGSNPTVLADGIELAYGDGRMLKILIAGDWMMFNFYPGSHPWYIMRLDGSNLHQFDGPFVPENAPGITDSTGKWRYELLSDGTAMILGPGSKLKLAGKLSIPGKVDKIPVTAIGENAFYGCEEFTGVSIPKTVTSIGNYAFFWCKGLTGVTVPEGVTSIGEGAFQWCAKVKKASLPASLTNIGGQVFENCPSIKLTVAKKSETFEVRDGVLFDKVHNRAVD